MVFPCEEIATGGELYFLCSAHNDLRIRADVLGRVNTSKNWKGWEVWRLVSSNRGDDTYFLSPWTHSQFYLSSEPGGRVTTSWNPYSWELWKVERESNATEHTVRIRSLAHDRFLQLAEGRLSTIEASRVSNKCWWNLEDANLSKYYLHCMGRNRQLHCPKRIEEAPFSTKTFDANGVWIFEKGEGDTFFIRSEARGWYIIQSDLNSSQVTLSLEPGGWQLTHHPSNGSVVITSSLGGRLVCSQDESILVQNDDDATVPANATSLRLVPHMPNPWTREQLAVVGGAGLVSIALGIASPHLEMELFHLLGFTTHGIAAGSFAAKQMSRIAKAHGGSIPSGHWFNTLQSIGILGLGTTRSLIAGVCGFLFGAILCYKILEYDKTSDPCTSGIVAAENMGGILSTMDDSIDERRALNHNNAPTGSEIVVNRNHPSAADGLLSMGSSSNIMFADASSAERRILDPQVVMNENHPSYAASSIDGFANASSASRRDQQTPQALQSEDQHIWSQ